MRIVKVAIPDGARVGDLAGRTRPGLPIEHFLDDGFDGAIAARAISSARSAAVPTRPAR